MRYLFLLRGLSGCGKSSWIKENQLSQYTLSTDGLRTMFTAPMLDMEGNPVISNVQDDRVMQFLHIVLEEKMARGEMVIIDATHYRSRFIRDYKELSNKYRYRVFVVDFTDIPVEVCKERNLMREKFKQVPEDVIERMWETVKQNNDKLPSFAKVISREECLSMIHDTKVYDYNKWDRVAVFGDIHGCFQPLQRYFEQFPFDDNTFYLFTGDYIDRGLQNKEVLEFLFSIMDKPNVLFLEGNHEKWLRGYANNIERGYIGGNDLRTVAQHLPMFSAFFRLNKITSKEFVKSTIPQIQDMDRKAISRFCAKLGQMAYFNFNGRDYMVCHGGIPCLPSVTISSEQFIKGVGKYEDTNKLYASLAKYADTTTFIHAHRNLLKHDVKATDNVYNLCDDVEWGEYLRVLHINKSGVDTFKFKNDIYRKHDKPDRLVQVTVDNLKSSPLTRVINFGEISSINFTRNAFENKQWNALSCTARGLFVQNHTNAVVARSYNKFFNLNERPETRIGYLTNHLKFPVNVYLKENGFLGIVSVYNGDFLFCSKTSISSEFADYVRDLFTRLFSKEQQAYMFDYMQKNKCTMVFECIHASDTQHPILYGEERMVLLDVIKNDLKYQHLPFEEMSAFADAKGIDRKKKVKEIHSMEELDKFFTEGDCALDTAPQDAIEGYVFEDSNDYMFKFKTTYYMFWKWQRSIMERLLNKKEIKSSAWCADDVRVYNLMKQMIADSELTRGSNIKQVEVKYYAQKKLA